jgi:hypothetical protein
LCRSHLQDQGIILHANNRQPVSRVCIMITWIKVQNSVRQAGACNVVLCKPPSSNPCNIHR